MIDIKGSLPGPAGDLSNFRPYTFVFDGVVCASAEGVLQSFKYDDPEVQREICKLTGKEAKNRGQERNEAWWATRKLWWQGKEYLRDGSEYQLLLDRLYDALVENSDFQKALLASGEEELRHSIGSQDAKYTILTEEEFCSRLMIRRTRLRSANR